MSSDKVLLDHQRGDMTRKSDTSIYYYALLNPLSDLQPVQMWLQQGWEYQAIPLYYQTPLASITDCGPWLMALSERDWPAIYRWSQVQTDPSWGWLYTSHQTWMMQIEHWHRYLQVEINQQLQILRFHDPRVLMTWLPDEGELWSHLLGPVTALWVAKQHYLRPRQATITAHTTPWHMPIAYLSAWQRSAQGIAVLASTLEIDLWENHPDDAEARYRQGDDILTCLQHWLTEKLASDVEISQMTIANFLQEQDGDYREKKR